MPYNRNLKEVVSKSITRRLLFLVAALAVWHLIKNFKHTISSQCNLLLCCGRVECNKVAHVAFLFAAVACSEWASGMLLVWALLAEIALDIMTLHNIRQVCGLNWLRVQWYELGLEFAFLLLLSEKSQIQDVAPLAGLKSVPKSVNAWRYVA
jgi:hypothetical protein